MKRIVVFILAVFLVMTPGIQSLHAATGNVLNSAEHSESPISLNTADHIQYMNGDGQGRFRPDRCLTRAEAAQLVFNLLLKHQVASPDNFTDVPKDSYYFYEVGALKTLGVLDDVAGNGFRPDEEITRAEFLAMFSHFSSLAGGSNPFSDVPADHWAVCYVVSAYSKGWIKGGPGRTFRPDDSLTRAEAATMANRILFRKADRNSAYARKGISCFTDVNKSHWAYYDILEASIRHEYVFADDTGGESWTDYDMPRGFYLLDGELYYADPNGRFVSNASMGHFKFDSRGCYTSGNKELDDYITGIVFQVTDDSMTRYEMLQAVYAYVRDNYGYTVREHYPRGATGWEEESALFFKEKGLGNCYCFAATFMYLARQLGYDAWGVSGGIGSNNADHGWTMIRFDDGKDYMFDAGMDWGSRSGIHGEPRYYNLFKFTPDTAPFIYCFP